MSKQKDLITLRIMYMDKGPHQGICEIHVAKGTTILQAKKIMQNALPLHLAYDNFIPPILFKGTMDDNQAVEAYIQEYKDQRLEKEVGFHVMAQASPESELLKVEKAFVEALQLFAGLKAEKKTSLFEKLITSSQREQLLDLSKRVQSNESEKNANLSWFDSRPH